MLCRSIEMIVCFFAASPEVKEEEKEEEKMDTSG